MPTTRSQAASGNRDDTSSSSHFHKSVDSETEVTCSASDPVTAAALASQRSHQQRWHENPHREKSSGRRLSEGSVQAQPHPTLRPSRSSSFRESFTEKPTSVSAIGSSTTIMGTFRVNKKSRPASFRSKSAKHDLSLSEGKVLTPAVAISSSPNISSNYEADLSSVVSKNNRAMTAYGNGHYDRALALFHEAHAKYERYLDCNRKVAAGLNVADSGGNNKRSLLMTVAKRLSSTGRSRKRKDPRVVPMQIDPDDFMYASDDDEDPTSLLAPDPPTTSYIYQRMDFDEGMQAHPGCERIHAALDSTEIVSTLLFNMGQVHRCIESFDMAAHFYRKAWTALVDGIAASDDEFAIRACKGKPNARFSALAVPILQNMGQLQYRLGKIPEAIKSYEGVLYHSEAAHGSDHTSVGSALNSLGVLHYHLSSDKSDEAMQLFHRSLSIQTAALGRDSSDRATVLNNIGRIHVQRDEFDEALGYYEEALTIRRAKLGIDSLDFAATAFNAGQSYHQRGKLDRALELYREFLRVAKKKFAGNHRDVAVVLSGIAQIHQERGENDNALELYQESLRVGRAALGDYHSEVAMLLNRLGNFLFEQDDLDGALRAYREGLRIERKVLEPDHPNIIVTLSNLGEIHRQRADWTAAVRLYHQALDLQKKKLGPDHVDIATTLNTIGLIYDQKGDTCKALRYLQDALVMRRKVLGENDLELSATLTYTGTILYRRNMLSMAMDLFTESLKIRTAVLGPDHRDVAFTNYNIGLVHQQRGSYLEAIECYKETLRVEKLVLGDEHRDVAMTCYKLGEVYKSQGDEENALQSFKTALLIERQTIGDSDPATVARTLNEIGNIHLAHGDVIEMMDAFNEASRIYRSAGLSPNNVVVSGQLYAFDISCPEAAPAA